MVRATCIGGGGGGEGRQNRKVEEGRTLWRERSGRGGWGRRGGGGDRRWCEEGSRDCCGVSWSGGRRRGQSGGGTVTPHRVMGVPVPNVGTWEDGTPNLTLSWRGTGCGTL